MPTFPDDSLLEAEALECIRGERLLFRDIGFRLTPGTLLQVEGPNGSGKSSLLRILAGLTLAESGEVRWCGRPIGRDRIGYASVLSYLGHRTGLKGELSPLENLAVAAALAGGAGLSPGEALERTGLSAQAELACRRLSAGQQRRAALARLLVNPAPLWILDEPYTALDVHGIALVNDLVEAHLAAAGLVVLTSHQPVAVRAPDSLNLRLGND